MRKPKSAIEAPTEGYSLIVDGHFKSHHTTIEAAEQAAVALKNRYRMLLQSDEERAQALMQKGQSTVKARWTLYEQMAAMHYGENDQE